MELLMLGSAILAIVSLVVCLWAHVDSAIRSIAIVCAIVFYAAFIFFMVHGC